MHIIAYEHMIRPRGFLVNVQRDRELKESQRDPFLVTQPKLARFVDDSPANHGYNTSVNAINLLQGPSGGRHDLLGLLVIPVGGFRAQLDRSAPAKEDQTVVACPHDINLRFVI